MNVRTGFVSNSSSSSFVLLSKKDFEIAKQCNLVWYRASDILEAIDKFRNSLPGFMDAEFYFYLERVLRELVLKNPNACITDAYDRDWACQCDIDLTIFTRAPSSVSVWRKND